MFRFEPPCNFHSGKILPSWPQGPFEHCWPDGTFLSRLTAEYPPLLAASLATMVNQFTSCHGQFLTLSQWRSMLPVRVQWPLLQSRVEDGGGLPSTALHVGSTGGSIFDQLRKSWFQRLCDSKACLKIFAHLQKGSRDPPLNESELSPYIDECCHEVRALSLKEQSKIFQQPKFLQLRVNILVSRLGSCFSVQFSHLLF